MPLINEFTLILAYCLVRIAFNNSKATRYYVRQFMFLIAIALSSTLALLAAVVLYPLGMGIQINQVLAYCFRSIAPLLSTKESHISWSPC